MIENVKKALSLIQEKRSNTAGLGGIELLLKAVVENPFVYIVESGCRYEGGSVNGVYSTNDLATAKALEMVEYNNKFRLGTDLEPFKEKESGVWQTDVDFIQVRAIRIN